MLGTEEGTATFRRKVDSLPTLETVNRRQMLLLWNQPLRYYPDTMASCLWTSKDIQLRDRRPTSSVIKTWKKGKDPNIHIIDRIHNIKGRIRICVNVFNSNYTNKHVTLNKGEHVGHLELPIEDMQWLSEDSEALTAQSSTTKRMMAKKVEPDLFKPSCHKLKKDTKSKLEDLLKEYQSQFTQDEATTRTTPLTKMTIDTGNSELVSQKPYPIVMKLYKWVEHKINKLLIAKVIQGSWSIWSAPIIVVLKEMGWKGLVINYCALNKITRKFIWPMLKVEDIFSQLNGMKYFSTLDLWAGYHHIPLDESSILITAFTSLFGKYEYTKVPFRLAQAPAYIQELVTIVLKDFPFAIAYLDDIIIFSRTAEEYLDHFRQVFKKLWNAQLLMKLSKCHFFAKEIQYLGHILSTMDIRPLPSKTQAINNMHPPKTANKYVHS